MTEAERAALLARLERMPDEVEELARSVSPEHLTRKGSSEEFSFAGHACHLRDLEVEGYAVRVRRLLGEERPSLAGFDGARVAAERDYDSEDFGEALAAFGAARRANVETVRSLDAASFAREGLFEETGETVTLDGLLRMMREHDEEHLEQLRALQYRER